MNAQAFKCLEDAENVFYMTKREKESNAKETKNEWMHFSDRMSPKPLLVHELTPWKH